MLRPLRRKRKTGPNRILTIQIPDPPPRATVFSRTFVFAECHGTTTDLDQSAGEAGRSCGRFQQPGAFRGVQVASVSRRTFTAPEDLSCALVRVADHDRCMDPVLGHKLSRRRSEFRNCAAA